LKGCDLFDVLPIYESLTLDQANERLRDHVRWERLAVSIVSNGPQAGDAAASDRA